MKEIEGVVIPTYADKSPRWEVRADLSGQRYTFFVSYNTAQDAWLMSISDAHGSLLIAGLRLVPGIPLLEKYRASCPALPPGELVLFDREDRLETAEVTRDNLSGRFDLTYMVFKEV